MTVRGADARKRRVSRLLTAVLTTALIGTLQFVAPLPAAAFIGNVIPANELEEPTDTFTTANALFAFVTTDPRGGRVCVVPEATIDPGDGSLSCNDAVAWASPNFVSGIGTVIIPVKGPYLRVGTWKLLADSSQGAADALSVPFTVRPCIDCDTALADSILADWKAAAATSGESMGNLCRASAAYGRLTQAKKAGKFLRTAANVSPVLSFVAVGSGGGGLLMSVFPSFTPQTLIKLGVEMIADLSCAVQLMYDDIVADPPDPNFDEITTPAGIVSPVSGDPLVDALSTGFSDVVAQGKAMRISMERYQGALVAGDTGAVAAQLDATAQFGETLAVEMRGLADDLRAFGAEADADPDENDPVLDQVALTETIQIYQRVQAQGFSADELSQLTAAGLTPAEIQLVEDAFDLDMASTPIDQSFNTIVQAAADNLEESADQFIEVALAAGAVAATLGAIDPAGPTAIDDVISTVAGAPSAVNVLANDTGAGALSVTASTNGAHGDVLCATSGLCTYSPAVGFTGTDSFTYTVTDGSGLTDIGSVAVTVGAVDPTNDPPIVDAGPDVALSESSRWFSRTPSIQDPDGTIQSVVWDFGDGTSSAGAYASHTYASKGTFTATLTVTDDDGAVSSDTVVVTITNADPVIGALQVPQRTAPDVERPVYVSFYDPGGLDTVTGILDFGDGTSTVANVSGAPVPHTWADPGTYTVTVTMDDGDGGTATRTASVLVKAATVDAGPDRSGDEGQELTFVRPLDGAQDHELAVTWDFGDGTTQSRPATSVSPVTHTYGDSGPYTLTLTLYGGSLEGPISDTATVTLANLNPTVSGIATTGLPVRGSPMSFHAFMSDPGVDDVLTASWDFGDGAVATGTAVQHTYAAAGTYTVMTIAEDDDGGASTAFSTPVTVSSPGTTSGPIDSSGRDFWLAFNRNYYGVATSLTLFITAATTTSGTVEIPGIGFSVPFDVAAGTVTSVELPEDASLGAPPSGAPTIEPRGIHVRSQDDVSVYGLNYFPQTTDAFSGLPTDALGTDYRVMTYYPDFLGQQISVVGTVNDTVVTVTPTVHLYEGVAGVPFEVTVDLGEVLNLPRPLVGGDLTGTRIQSSHPVAVFSGDICANVPSTVGYCDHLVEQLTPTSAWGRRFVTTPLASRANGDTFRILAATDSTEVRINGERVATLDDGELHEQILTEASVIDASSPVLVAQFANGSGLSGDPGDPFMMLIPPYEQYANSYTVTTPASGFEQSYVSIVARGTGAGVTLDGSTIPTGSFSPIGTSGYAGAAIPVEPGTHNLSASQPFGLAIYGFNRYESYGYTGGGSLADVASVIRVDLTPATGGATTGTSTCVTGTAVDADGGPVVGVRMDFAVTGANPTSGFAVTDAGGAAEFCYVGLLEGLDTITGTVSGIYDTATRTWSGVTPVNHAPVGVADGYSTPQDSVLTVDAATGVLANDTDADGDSLTAANVTDPAHGSVDLAADGSFVYTPTAGYVGPDAFTYTANDALVPSAATTVSIDVNAVNHAPTVGLVVDQTIPELVQFNLTLSGADPDGDMPLQYSAPTAPTGLSVGQSTGVLDWTPTEAQGPGDYPVTVRVTDPDGLYAERSFSIHVTEVNTSPALAAIADRTVNPGDAVSLTASGSDPDLPANALTYSVVSGPSGAAVDSTTGAFSWTAGSTPGDYAATIRVTDPDGLFVERSFTIHVVRDATTLTLGGDSSGQYSDNARITATLKVGDTPVPGATVSIGLGAASTNVTTNASGVATATFAIPGPVASLPVTASFAGTASKAPSSANGSLTVKLEDSTVVYAGDATGLAGSTLHLSAGFTDSSVAGFTGSNPETGSSATSGDITRARVAFAIYSAASCLSGSPVATVSAFVADTGPTGDGIGTAEATWSSASEGSFCIASTLVGAGGTGMNGFYTAPPAQAAGLAIYIDATGKVTGGGWIPHGDGRANFGLNAKSDGSKAKGNLVFIDRTIYLGKNVMLIVKSNAIDTLRASGSTFPISATLTGKASFKYISSVNGSTLFESGNATFSATVIDSDATGGAGDAFAIRVLDRARNLLVELGSTPLGGGNVVAHLK